MAAIIKYGALALAVAQSSNAGAIPNAVQRRDVDESCSHTYVRKPWDQLTSDEKSNYLDAELCLMSASPQLDDNGAENRWDELQYTHIVNTGWIHFVGAFLPWHRYFLLVHSQMLKDECGYTGSIPYWNEPNDVSNGLANSSLWEDTAFGGNGTGSDQCVETGPFSNLTLHIDDDAEATDDYCLSRDWLPSTFEDSSQSDVDTCMAKTTYVDFWDCIEQTPHAAGHGGTGGTMSSTARSPGDPVFYLHHGFLDMLWASWQAQDPSNRTYWIGGTNVADNFDGTDAEYHAWHDYNGDGDGNTTTLNHVLYMVGLADNITANDIMNISNSVNCVEYVYLD